MSYLFFDIDGTLVTDHHLIRPSAIESVKQVEDHGHDCLLCTGRPLAMCEQILDAFDMHSAIINDGAAVIDRGEVIISHPISQDIVEDTIRKTYQHNGSIELLGIHFCYQDAAAYQLFYDFRKEIYKNEDINVHMHKEGLRRIDECQEEIYKMDVFFPTLENSRQFQSEMSPALQYIPAGGYTKEQGPKDGEIILKTVSKGTGIREYVRAKHGDLSDTYGFGDSDNDLGMLQTVAHPTVMQPGTENILKLAEYVARPPEKDGIRQALTYYQFI